MEPPAASMEASPAAPSSSSLLSSLDAFEAVELRFCTLRAGPEALVSLDASGRDHSLARPWPRQSSRSAWLRRVVLHAENE